MTYGIQRFNAAFTRAPQQSLSWVESTQFLVLIHIPLRSILILSSHLHLGLLKGPIKLLKALLPSSGLAKWTAHLNLIDWITLISVNRLYKMTWQAQRFILWTITCLSHMGKAISLSGPVARMDSSRGQISLNLYVFLSWALHKSPYFSIKRI